MMIEEASGLEQALALSSTASLQQGAASHFDDLTHGKAPYPLLDEKEGEEQDDNQQQVQDVYELDPCDWEEDEEDDDEGEDDSDDEDAAEAPPSHRSLSNKWVGEAAGPYHACLSSDHRTAYYIGKANHAQDVGTVKADRPLPHDQAYFYFEVQILESSDLSSASIGLAPKGFPLNRQPGTWPDSYGYSGVEGKISSSEINPSKGKEYGPTFTKGDVIGCGVDFARQQVFYTKNGKCLGVAFRDIFKTSPTSSSSGGGGGGSGSGSRARQQQQIGRMPAASSSSSSTPSSPRPTSLTPRLTSILLSRSRAASVGSASSSSGSSRQGAVDVGSLRYLPRSSSSTGGGASVSSAAGGDGGGGGQLSSSASSLGPGRVLGTGASVPSTSSSTLPLGSRASRDHLSQQQQQQQGHEENGATSQTSAITTTAAGAGAAVEVRSPHFSRLEFFAVVSMHCPGDVIRVNFGQEPFKFDLKAKRQQDEAEVEASMKEIHHVGRAEVRALIKDYLMTQGYESTMRSFVEATTLVTGAEMGDNSGESGGGGGGDTSTAFTMEIDEGGDASSGSNTAAGESTKEERNGGIISGGKGLAHHHHQQQHRENKRSLDSLVQARRQLMVESLSDRMALREEICQGQITAALNRLQKRFAHVLKAKPLLKYELQCLEFIDMLRQGDLPGAVMYAQQELASYVTSTAGEGHKSNKPSSHVLSRKTHPLQSSQQRSSSSAADDAMEVDGGGGGGGGTTTTASSINGASASSAASSAVDQGGMGGGSSSNSKSSKRRARRRRRPSATSGPSPVAAPASTGHHQQINGEGGGGGAGRVVSPKSLMSKSSPAVGGGSDLTFEPTPLDYAVRLRDVMGLLAYQDVDHCPLAYLGCREHAENVAEMANNVILEMAAGRKKGATSAMMHTTGFDANRLDRPLLEHVLVQLAVVQEALKDYTADGRGESFRLPAIPQAKAAASPVSSSGPPSSTNGLMMMSNGGGGGGGDVLGRMDDN